MKSKGDKHPRCSALQFSALVKYWETKELKEESKRMKLAR